MRLLRSHLLLVPLLMTAAIAISLGNSEDLVLQELSLPNGEKVQYRVTKETLARTPNWLPGTPVPVAVEKVREIAQLVMAAKQSGAVNLTITSICLNSVTSDFGTKWFYYVVGMPLHGTVGMRDSRVLVLMDRTIIEPTPVKARDEP